MVEDTDEKRFEGRQTEVDPQRLPSPPHGVSRIDTLPVDFISSISRRPRLIGDLIGNRYKLVEALGDGAMGQVFVAENQVMGRRVAVRLLKPTCSPTHPSASASSTKQWQSPPSSTATWLASSIWWWATPPSW